MKLSGLNTVMTFFEKKHLLKFTLIFLTCFLTFNASAQESQSESTPKPEATKAKSKPNALYADQGAKDEGTKWERFESITGIFSTKFPHNYRYRVFPFQFNKNTVAFSTEIISALDGKEVTKDKSILIRAVQTFGDRMTGRDIKRILDRETRKYAQSVRAIGGTVLTNEDATYKNFPAKRLYITYIENGEKFGMRIRIFLTDHSKIEQVLTGPAETMYSYRSDDFFDSLKLFDGITHLKEPKDIGNGWRQISSKNNIFTVTVPPKNTDYTPVPPRFRTSQKREAFNFQFIDPIREETMFYNVYSYKLDSKVTYENAKSLLFANHITKFVKNASIDSLKTENNIIDGVNVMTTKLIITPPTNLPYINTIFMEVHYKDDTIVVQEVMASAGHARSELPSLLMDTLKFHPEKYSYTPRNKAQKKPADNPDDEIVEEDLEETEDSDLIPPKAADK
tara:strand:+ start:14541 stop:15893 length:1353 start_codon:yes stop_codon:yes gene_type:complete